MIELRPEWGHIGLKSLDPLARDALRRARVLVYAVGSEGALMARSKGKMGKKAKRGGRRGGGRSANRAAAHRTKQPRPPALPGHSELQRACERRERTRVEQLLSAPATDAQSRRRRLLELLRWWPELATERLAAGAYRELDEADTVAIALHVALGGEEQAWQALQVAGWPLLADAAVLRAAAAATSAGEHDSARELLRGVGLRSPLRQGRLFVRGLVALHQGDAASAGRALRALVGSEVLGTAARTLLLAAPGGDEGRASDTPDVPSGPAAEAWMQRLGGERAALRLRLTEVAARLRAGQGARALRAAARIDPKRSPEASLALRRGLLGYLLRRGTAPAVAAERVARAMPDVRTDSAGRHLQALAADFADAPEVAEAAWRRWQRDLQRGRVGVAARARATAALLKRRADICLGMADEPELDCDCPDCRRHRERAGASDEGVLRQRALTYLEQACALAPEHVDLWLHRLALLTAIDGERAGQQFLEKVTARFPEHPQVAYAAALACLGRKAFDKGMRHARRAIALEPLGSEARDVLVRLHIGKARRRARAAKLDAARELLRRAGEVSGVGRLTRIELAGDADALHRLTAPDQEPPTTVAAARDATPYLLVTWSVEAEHIYRGLLARADVAVPPPRRAALPTVRPAPGELRTLLDGYDSAGDWATRDNYAGVTAQAAARGGTELRRLEDFVLCADLLELHEALPVAETAARLFPDEVGFIWWRYAAALAAAQPPSYFADALAEVGRAQRLLERDDPPDDGGFGLGFTAAEVAAMRVMGPFAKGRLRELGRSIRKILRQPGRKAASRRGKRRGGKRGRRGTRDEPSQGDLPF